MKYLTTINLNAVALSILLSLSGWMLIHIGNSIELFPVSLAGSIINSVIYPAFFAMIRNPAWDQDVPAGWDRAIPNHISMLIGFLQIAISSGAVAYFVRTRNPFLLFFFCLASITTVSVAAHIIIRWFGYTILLFTN